MRITILGITGYTASAIVSILARHPNIEEIIPVSQSAPHQPLATLLPQLGKELLPKLHVTQGKTVAPKDAQEIETDLLFSCLPHTHSGPSCMPYIDICPIIDLSADFRFNDASLYEQIYETSACIPPPKYEVAYGLAEWNREKIRKARVIAVPGCYATSCLIPLLPLAKAACVASPLVINAISGISGAGKSMHPHLMFCERNESIRAYLPGTQHRHHAEIKEKLSLETLPADPPTLWFTPHLAPMTRGISATITATLHMDAKKAIGILKEYYHHEPFIGIQEESFPESSWVQGTNKIEIGLHAEDNVLFISSVSDNLIKGAAGQAVQNMNIMHNIEEGTGLH